MSTSTTQPETANGRTKPRRLALREAVELTNWVSRYWPEIERRRPTMKETTSLYNRERHAADPDARPITPPNLRHVVQELGLIWPNNPARRIARTAAILNAKIDTLATELRDMAANLAERIDNDSQYLHSPAFEAAFPVMETDRPLLSTLADGITDPPPSATP